MSNSTGNRPAFTAIIPGDTFTGTPNSTSGGPFIVTTRIYLGTMDATGFSNSNPAVPYFTITPGDTEESAEPVDLGTLPAYDPSTAVVSHDETRFTFKTFVDGEWVTVKGEAEAPAEPVDLGYARPRRK